MGRTPPLEAPVVLLPHDLDDLGLAPVVLTIDARLEELGRLSAADLRFRVAVETDRPDWTAELRASALLQTVSRFVELHGWVLAWDPRGLRLSHADHTVVLGVPPLLREFAGS